ncbi:MAG: response regulator [Deltaproteobacteria bacterium]|nr:response regulator [Deltaproteobacteria bacterium]
MSKTTDGSVIIVDDDAFVLETTAFILTSRGFLVNAYGKAADAVKRFREKRPDVVLTDVKMPGTTGIQLLEELRSISPDLPVILMTAYAELDVAVEAVKKGAFDFIIKPFSPEYLIHSVEKAVNYAKLVSLEKNYKGVLEREVRKRTDELAGALKMVKNMSKELALRLTTVAEYRDTDTGEHIKRIGLYCASIAAKLKLSPEFVETMAFASSMHDIGKIGIPDSILLKPGSLTGEEFDVMKTHSAIGARMLEDSPYPAIQLAASIALVHHERWDGTGYPKGLKGTAIPIEGRIIILADQYDALTSKRPYKKAFSHEDTVKIITEGDGRTKPEHFDPDILKTFIEIEPEFKKIRESLED